jgi:outer membrane protein assembly factor BamB
MPDSAACLGSATTTALAIFGALATAAFAADQPQWGQRWSRNMSSDERGLPETFDPKTGQNIKWIAPLGTETHATPVVAGGRVYIGTNNGRPRDPRHQGDRGVLLCLDEKTGELLWQLVVPKIKASMYWDWPNAGTCSPATVEGDRVYIVSNRGEVLCLDARGMANGNNGPFRDEARHCVPPGEAPIEPGETDADIVWLFDMIKELGVRQHDSAHASVLIHGDFLYVNTSNGVDDSHKQIHSPDAPSLIAIEKSTGRLVARDDEHIGPNVFHSTWSSPALGEVNGRPRVFFCGGNGVVYGFEPLKAAPPAGEVAKLKKVWQFDFDPGAPKENIHDYLRNREVSPSNMHGMPVFDANRLYVAGGGDLWWGKNEAWLKCIDATGSGDVTKTALVWSYALEKHVMATPAVWRGLVFIADCGHKIHCVDVAAGKPLWTHDAGAEVWASPLVAEGKVYVATRRGEVFVFAADKEKKLLSQASLGDASSSTPVAANGTLYFATMKNLYALAAGAQAASPARQN